MGNLNWFRLYTPLPVVMASPTAEIAAPSAVVTSAGVTSAIVKPANVLITSEKKKNRLAPHKSAIHFVKHALIRRKSNGPHAHKKLSPEGIK
jgi:hypothetical protein